MRERDCLDLMGPCKQIINIYQTIEDDDNLYFVLEIAENGTLDKIMKKHGPIEKDYARYVLGQIILGLEAMHKEDWAHRDLKPANILVDEKFSIKLIDFGEAKQYKNEETGDSTIDREAIQK